MDKNRNTKIITFTVLMASIIGTGDYFGNKITFKARKLGNVSNKKSIKY